jgi:hypothetical protein
MDEKDYSPFPRVFISYSYSDLMDDRKKIKEILHLLLKNRNEEDDDSESNDSAANMNKSNSETNLDTFDYFKLSVSPCIMDYNKCLLQNRL